MSALFDLPVSTASHSSTRLHPLERRLQLRTKVLTRDLPASPLILVACSGGADSIALAEALIAAAMRAQVRVAIAHIHHGGAGSGADAANEAANDAARDAARDATRDAARDAAWRLADRHSTPFFESTADEAPSDLRSEAALRAFRYERLSELKSCSHAHVIALAHHADDLLETRLIRLIRGTGPGGLEAMREYRAPLWRPFLRESKRALTEYCATKQLQFMEDPSNASLAPLRNWIRHKWLPDLEEKRPGAVGAVARSLEFCAQSFLEKSKSTPMVEAGTSIERNVYRDLPEAEQVHTLARLLREAGAENVTSSRALEAQKRLRSRRRSFEFTLGGVHWNVNAEQIVARCAARLGSICDALAGRANLLSGDGSPSASCQTFKTIR